MKHQTAKAELSKKKYKFIIPTHAYYKVTLNLNSKITEWVELRKMPKEKPRKEKKVLEGRKDEIALLAKEGKRR